MKNCTDETRKAWRDLGAEFLEAMEELGVLTPVWENTWSDSDSLPTDNSELELYEEAAAYRKTWINL